MKDSDIVTGPREKELAALVAFRKRTISRCIRAAQDAASAFEAKGKVAEREGALAAVRAIEAVEAEATEQEPGAMDLLERDRKHALLQDALEKHLWISGGSALEVEARGKELKAFREGVVLPAVLPRWDHEDEGYRLPAGFGVVLCDATPQNPAVRRRRRRPAIDSALRHRAITLAVDPKEVIPMIALLAKPNPQGDSIQVEFWADVILSPGEEYLEHPLRAVVEDAARGGDRDGR